MNKEIQRIITTAKRTLRIATLIQDGATAQEIVSKAGCNRQLADYYLLRVKKAEED